jgi:23S rRNA (cytosine1962-C5)-methyltransferase
MYQLLSPTDLSFYELIDSGNFEKLERFGDYILARPEPQAVWNKSLSDDDWMLKAHAVFKKTKGGDDKGEWRNIKNMPEKWWVKYDAFNLNLKLSLSSFKHVGVFPEQASNWQYIEQKIKAFQTPQPKILNLFAYTGIASLVAKKSGADITHVDSIKQVVAWSRESMEASNLDNIRWIVEDAMKFVKREIRRGSKYNGIILDPPAYGRGANGEKWVLEEGINELIQSCAEILDEKENFFVMNLYSMGFSALIPQTLVKLHFGNVPNQEIGELYLNDSFDKKLPLGVFFRFASV